MKETRKIDDRRLDTYSCIFAKMYNGCMPYAVYKLIDKVIDEIGLADDDVYSLFAMAKKCHKLYDYAWIEDCARKNFTQQQQDNIPASSEDFNHDELVKRIANRMTKIVQKPMNGLDMEKIERWLTTDGYDEKSIEFACKCNEYRDVITMKNVDDKLREWIEEGVTTLEEAEMYEEARHEANKKKFYQRLYGRTINIDIYVNQ